MLDVCFQLLPVSVAYTMGINQQEESASRIQYDGSGYTPPDSMNSAQIAMDNSLDNGYTISVKTKDEKPDLLTEETLQIVEPRHWTVNDRGVLVNADESQVAIKVEKPDWTTETETADCSTTLAGQGDSETKGRVMIVKEEGTVCSDPQQITAFRNGDSGEEQHTCTVATVCGTEFRFLNKLHVPAVGQAEFSPYVCNACSNSSSRGRSRTVHEQTHSRGDLTGAASVEKSSLPPDFCALSCHVHHHTE